MSKIEQFNGAYRFLSNFHDHPVAFDGLTYRNSEAAFQAQKTEAEAQRMRFTKLLPGEAKRLGRQVTMRHDWDEVKLGVMLAVCRAKFTDQRLGAMLLDTGDAELIEGNTWGDRFWGVVDGSGANHLGRILMRIRTELRTNADEADLVEDVVDVDDVKPEVVDDGATVEAEAVETVDVEAVDDDEAKGDHGKSRRGKRRG